MIENMNKAYKETLIIFLDLLHETITLIAWLNLAYWEESGGLIGGL